MRQILLHVLAWLALAAAAAPAAAGDAASPWERRPEADVRLVAAVDATGSLAEIPVGLEIRMPPGWKTYWRAPGEGGLPPSLDWKGSANVGGATMLWPAPERLSILGIDSIGYEKHVLFPIRVRPAKPGGPVGLRLGVDFLTCATICVPQHADLSLDLPAGTATPSAQAFAISQATGAVPAGPGATLSVTRAAVAGSALHVTAVADPPLRHPDLFVEAGPDALAGRPRVTLTDGGRRAAFDVPLRLPQGARAPAPGSDVTFTLVDGDRALEQRVTLAAAAGGGGSGRAGLGGMLLVALLGGLILNLMPCVLPVLSIKLLAIVGHGGGEAAAARRSFLATSSGIVASFMVLAAAAIALKLAGLAVGWGIQFQQPVFLAAMVAVLCLFAANLAGFFELALPSGVGTWAGTRGGGGTAGAFATGFLATLLATPCSAPFVGTALGFALARGPVEIAAIFLALGFGLAAPYLAVAAFPGIALRLPRPGRWMVRLRLVLALAVLATAGWLAVVLDAVAGAAVAASVAGAGLAAPLVLAFGRRVSGPAGRIAAAVLVAAAVAAPLVLEGTGPASAAPRFDDALWQPFDRARIDRLVGEGRVVLVDVTADWCITCQVNKATVLSSDAVQGLLRRGEVTGLLADWTRPSDAIAAYLATFGRYGIPFNAVYGPKAPQGIALPEILTVEAVTAAVSKARN